MAFPIEFVNWWTKQPTFKASAEGLISEDLYNALSKMAFSGWQAREREIITLKVKLGDTPIDLFEEIQEIISKKLGVDRERVTEDAYFIDSLHADSLDTVELIMAFEDHYNIEIPDEDAEKIRTVGDAIKRLREILGR